MSGMEQIEQLSRQAEDAKELERDQMLACKDGKILVVENEVEHRHLEREGGWSFRVYTPKRKRQPAETSPNWIEQTPTGMRIPLGGK